MYNLEVYFTNRAKVTIRFDNLVELGAVIRGLEIGDRESNNLDKVVVWGGKLYNFKSETDND